MNRTLICYFTAIFILFSCNSSKLKVETAENILPENIKVENDDVICDAMKEISILEQFDSEKTNIGSIVGLIAIYAENGIKKHFVSNKEELNNRLNTFADIAKKNIIDLQGKEYLVNETEKRILEKVDFETQNLIIITINSGGPPYHKLHCTQDGNSIHIQGVKEETMISGAALYMKVRFFVIEKSIVLG